MVAAADDKVSDEDVKVIERSACPTCGSCSGMFTANSMNCLTEALGLSLPGNGSTLATHADRRRLFVEAGHLIVDLALRHYEGRSIDEIGRTLGVQRCVYLTDGARPPFPEHAQDGELGIGGARRSRWHGGSFPHEASTRLTAVLSRIIYEGLR